MKTFLKDSKFILKSERGVALMMIMTAIVILMAIYGEFTFESKISRIKATNVMDKAQAKLLAESGMMLAMTRLKLYREAYNKLESTPAAKQQVPPQLLNQLWEVPFIFPVPIAKTASVAVKDTINKFTEETLLDGEMQVSIANISNRMNLNLLRVNMIDKLSKNPELDEDGNPKEDPEENPNDGILDMNPTAIENNVSIDQSLYFLLRQLVEDKSQNDPAFEDRNEGLNYQHLITNLKYFMSDYMSLERDPLAGEAEDKFTQIPLTPKFGPLSSSSELFMIPGWSDELIELIQNEFSIYPAAQIDLNKLTENMLKVLLPTIEKDQIRAFFEYRDDQEAPKHFNSTEDFRKWAVDIERVVTDEYFKDRIEKFTKAGVTFGSNPSLFKITSVGNYNRSIFTLVAYVYLPKQDSTANQLTKKPDETDEEFKKRQEEAAKTNQLLEPRIIEIQII